MRVFLVGGAVRDTLMGRPVKDRDYVVEGATPEQMIELGYKPVGKDFPVFLHPENGEEYALARTERKVSQGHGGFEFNTSVDLKVDDDLYRRDLTINAIAQDLDSGDFIDPFGGLQDLQEKVLRHVSEAFAEDPLRVLRVARFASRYHDQGFTVADETMELMSAMVARGDLNELTKERVWMEIHKAFSDPGVPSVFIGVLRGCGALKVILPEVEALYGVPQNAEHHPEVDSGIHTEMVMDQAARLSGNDSAVVFAAMLHDLGKAKTDPANWPKHHKHEELGVEPTREVCARLKVPKLHASLAEVVCRDHLRVHRCLDSRPGTLWDMLNNFGALSGRDSLFEKIMLTCEADARGRLGLEDREYPQPAFLSFVVGEVRKISTAPLLEKGLKGKAVGDALKIKQLEVITTASRQWVKEYKELQELRESVPERHQAMSFSTANKK